MPIHLEISRLNRLLVIVARGQITPDEVRDLIRQMVENEVRHFSKIIDVSGSSIEMGREQVDAMAMMLRAEKGAATRGPIAFVIHPERRGFADLFADATKEDRPVRLFRSLHDARKWLQELPR
jgi:plasmid stability protein